MLTERLTHRVPLPQQHHQEDERQADEEQVRQPVRHLAPLNRAGGAVMISEADREGENHA
jgi:hypothetical protein